MLWYLGLLVLSLLGSVYGKGELSVLKIPKSMMFKGSDPLPSTDLYDLVYASLGYGVGPQANWTGLYILDPFYLPTTVMTISVRGLSSGGFQAEQSGDTSIRTYPIKGKDATGALEAVAYQLMTDGNNVCNLNFDEEIVFPQIKTPRPSLAEYTPGSGSGVVYENLHPQDLPADMRFLRNIDYFREIMDEIGQLQKDCQLIQIYFSLEDIVKEHGQESRKTKEALALLNKVIVDLTKFVAKYDKMDRNLLLLIFEDNSHDFRRIRRQDSGEEEGGEKASDLQNLAEKYDEDYAAMFNIILWFVVAFFFSLLAICYTIGSMDPGRDSIIYRMTSTRMKKDN